MALSKSGYRDAQQLSTKVRVNLNAAGYIATGDDEIASSKYISITRANAGNGLTENNKLFEFFVGMLDGSFIPNSNKASVTWQV